MTKPEELVRQMVEEYKTLGDLRFPVVLDLPAALCLVGSLQLSLRHPGNTGASARVAQAFIDTVIQLVREAGYLAHADLMRLGDDPASDTERAGTIQ